MNTSKLIISILLLFLWNCNPNSNISNSKVLELLLLQQQNTQQTNSVQTTNSTPDDVANSIISVYGQTGDGFKDENHAINGIRGGGYDTGSFDVFKLAVTGDGSNIVLEWKNQRILNGIGTDFIVFENPFRIDGSASNIFMKQLIVEVSIDNINYCGFDPHYINSPNTSYSRNPALWQNFAGITPVLYNQDTNYLSGNNMYDLTQTGGDGFDLDNLSSDNFFNIGCSVDLVSQIKNSGFYFIRLTSATNRIDKITNIKFLADPFSSGSNIDGVFGRYRASR